MLRPMRAGWATLFGLCALGTLTACGDRSSGRLLPTEISLAKGGNGGGGGGGGTAPTVNSTDPASAPQDVTLDVRVLGSGFDNGSVVAMLLDGKSTTRVRTNRTTFVSASELVANITIAADALVDLYDVQVTSAGGKKGIGIELFAVTGVTVELASLPGEPAPAGFYADGFGQYTDGAFNSVTHSKGKSGGGENFNLRPQCKDGRGFNLRLPTDANGNPVWSVPGVIAACGQISPNNGWTQLHLPGLLTADCASGAWCPIGQGLFTTFSSAVNVYFTVDGNGDGQYDTAFNVVWTDAQFSVVRYSGGGTPCEWHVVASTANLHNQSATPVTPTGHAVALNALVARHDGVCSAL